jgi:hypothetical protein
MVFKATQFRTPLDKCRIFGYEVVELVFFPWLAVGTRHSDPIFTRYCTFAARQKNVVCLFILFIRVTIVPQILSIQEHFETRPVYA